MADRGRKNVLGMAGLAVMVFALNGCQKSSGMALDQVHRAVSDEKEGIGDYLIIRNMESEEIQIEEDTGSKEIPLFTDEISLDAGDNTVMQRVVIPEQEEESSLLWNRGDETGASIKGTTSVSGNDTPDVIEEDSSESTSVSGDHGQERDNNTSPVQEEEENTESVSSSYFAQDYAQQVLDMVNARRGEAGLAPLVMNEALVSAARIRAVEIVQTFSHTRPNGTSCFTVLDEAGVGYSGAGENLAAGQWSPDFAMNSWMNSEGHRDNILNGNFSQIGIACYYDEASPYGYYWVQCFIH